MAELPADPADGPDPAAAPDPATVAPGRSARELVRGRRRAGASPDTGRRHHIGPAPAVVPLHTEHGLEQARTTSWQLADRTLDQLGHQQSATGTAMRQAAQDLEFERAARLRDELTAVEQEISRRTAPPPGP